MRELMKDMIEVVDLLIKKVREVRPDYVCTVHYNTRRAHGPDPLIPTLPLRPKMITPTIVVRRIECLSPNR